ncbi:MAG: ParB N-terminal domain-containing protein [Bacteriovoracaceae bacterium]|nr:ParB N-terminal domain-containing protein [Bacteriovoracaceae bacterium]
METRKLNELKATNPYLRLGTDVTELEKSIQTLGLIAPLVISPDNVILAGARRYQALLNLGYTEAPVMVIDRNPLEKELVSIDENLVRKDLSKIEIEAHLRRAKEIYQELNPEVESPAALADTPEEEEEDTPKVKKVVLPAEKFLNMVSEKTGLSPKQIHEAINRDEMASPMVKEARRNGELSLSQTNEIVKLNKEDQQVAIDHIKELPVREIKKFVKIAKTQGVQEAITATPNLPYQKEFQEIDQALKKLIKKFKQLEIEGFEFSSLPSETQKLFGELVNISEENSFSGHMRERDLDMDSLHQ